MKGISLMGRGISLKPRQADQFSLPFPCQFLCLSSVFAKELQHKIGNIMNVCRQVK